MTRIKPEPITVTEAAQAHIASVLSANPGTAFRVGVDSKGCAGHKYTFGLVPFEQIDTKADSMVWPWGKLVIDKDSVLYLLGSKLDIKCDGLNTQLVVDNPLALSTCGCGESFSLGTACSNASDTDTKTLL